MADDTPQEPVLDPPAEATTEQAPSVEAPEESVPATAPQPTTNNEPPTNSPLPEPVAPHPSPPEPTPPPEPLPPPDPQPQPTANHQPPTVAPPLPEPVTSHPSPPAPPTPPLPPHPSPPKPEPTSQVSDIKPQVSDADIVQSLTDEQLKLASSLYAKKHQKALSRKGVEARQAIAQKNIASIRSFIAHHSPANNRTIARALNLPPRRVQHYMQQLTHEGVVVATGWGISREYRIK